MTKVNLHPNTNFQLEQVGRASRTDSRWRLRMPIVEASAVVDDIVDYSGVVRLLPFMYSVVRSRELC